MNFKFNKATVKNMAKQAGKFIEKNAPAIAAGAALTAMVAAVVSAIKEGPKLAKSLEEAELKKNEKALADRMQNGDDTVPIENLTWKEKSLVYAKHYWKAVLLMLLSAAGMIASVHLSNKKIGALAVLAAAAESNSDRIESAVKSVVGEKKFEQIKGQIVEEQVENNPPKEGFIANTHNGDQLCFEPIFATYYWSDIAAVDRAYLDYREIYMNSGQTTMEDLYNLLQIPKPYWPANLDQVGHLRDEDEGFDNPPEPKPRSITVTLGGKKYTAYVVDINRPRSYDDVVNEQMAKKSFRKW